LLVSIVSRGKAKISEGTPSAFTEYFATDIISKP
jgi:hypothetical protein